MKSLAVVFIALFFLAGCGTTYWENTQGRNFDQDNSYCKAVAVGSAPMPNGQPQGSAYTPGYSPSSGTMRDQYGNIYSYQENYNFGAAAQHSMAQAQQNFAAAQQNFANAAARIEAQSARSAIYNQCMTSYGWRQVSEPVGSSSDQIRLAAEAGDPNAQYELALMYDFGRGVSVSHEQANAWYLKAARQGHDNAQYNLAISYIQGEGIEQDHNKGVYWLIQSAKNGDPDAFEVLTRYANNGNAEAQYALAQIYRNGVSLHNDLEHYPWEEDNSSITPDMGQYKYWLQKAARSGHPRGAEELGNLR